MEAKRSDRIPAAGEWQFEPKWDGFRALVFRDGSEVAIQSKAGQPLGRYFPEVIEAARRLKAKRFVLDGELVVPVKGRLSFDDLLLRIHPAASRIERLAREIPAQILAFDLLVEPSRGAGGARALHELPVEKRRAKLEAFFASIAADTGFILTPATTDRAVAREWFESWGKAGLDGVIAKRLGEPYHSGDREGMVKVKHFRDADCVVGGFRYSTSGKGSIGALLLGLYDDEKRLVYIGHCSSFNEKQREELKSMLEPLRGDNPFEVRVPGGPSRWASAERSTEWEPVAPKLVCEVRYDYFSQNRFRHGTQFLRWRPDKKPRQCTMDQVDPRQTAPKLSKLLG
jgi:ATP-dependent DNA ligase